MDLEYSRDNFGNAYYKAVAIDNDGNQRQHQIVISIVSPAEEGFERGDFLHYFWHNNKP